MAKNTNDLLDQLADNNCSIDDYLEENREDMIVLAAKDLGGDHFNAAAEYAECDVLNKADFNYCYFYDIVNGRKIASRDKVIWPDSQYAPDHRRLPGGAAYQRPLRPVSQGTAGCTADLRD